MTYNILIVDDNDNNRFSLRALLEAEDVCLYEAINGTETLAMIIEHRIDLIILDVQLPDYNGFQLAKMIKGRKSTKDIPIILATAVFKAQVFIEQGFEAGAVDYVLKPINGQVLLAKIAHYRALDNQHKEMHQQLSSLSEEKDDYRLIANRHRDLFQMLAGQVPMLVKVYDTSGEGYSNSRDNPVASEIDRIIEWDAMDDILASLYTDPVQDHVLYLQGAKKPIQLHCQLETLTQSILLTASYLVSEGTTK